LLVFLPFYTPFNGKYGVSSPILYHIDTKNILTLNELSNKKPPRKCPVTSTSSAVFVI